ncbi:MAG: response regulator transcription factor [bacterium]|nr:response regulator transcription factor [bacterium]
MTVTAIIADDEAPARNLIREFLAPFTEITVIAECEDGIEALETIKRLKPGILFLDIRMPGFTGFQVLEHLETRPVVIFSTAYSKYAVNAFDISAVDYLLKPYSQDRFNKAVQKALQSKQTTTSPGDISRLLETLHLQKTQSFSKRIFVKKQDRVIPVEVSDIVYLEADDDYVRIHTTQQAILASENLARLLSLLDPDLFIRIHRTFAVNIHFIKEYQKTLKGNYSVHMESGAILPVGRTFLRRIKERMV